MEELHAFLPYDPSEDQESWPFFKLTDVTVRLEVTPTRLSQYVKHRPRAGDLVDALDVTEIGRVRVFGKLGRLTKDHKSVLVPQSHPVHGGSEIVVPGVFAYAMEYKTTGRYIIWLLGKAGWYDITPAPEYTEIFEQMEEKARLWLFLEDQLDQIWRRRNKKHATVNQLWEAYLEQYSETKSLTKVRQLFRTHHRWILSRMFESTIANRWKKTPLYQAYIEWYGVEVEDVERAVERAKRRKEKAVDRAAGRDAREVKQRQSEPAHETIAVKSEYDEKKTPYRTKTRRSMANASDPKISGSTSVEVRSPPSAVSQSTTKDRLGALASPVSPIKLKTEAVTAISPNQCTTSTPWEFRKPQQLIPLGGSVLPAGPSSKTTDGPALPRKLRKGKQVKSEEEQDDNIVVWEISSPSPSPPGPTAASSPSGRGPKGKSALRPLGRQGNIWDQSSSDHPPSTGPPHAAPQVNNLKRKLAMTSVPQSSSERSTPSSCPSDASKRQRRRSRASGELQVATEAAASFGQRRVNVGAAVSDNRSPVRPPPGLPTPPYTGHVKKLQVASYSTFPDGSGVLRCGFEGCNFELHSCEEIGETAFVIEDHYEEHRQQIGDTANPESLVNQDGWPVDDLIAKIEKLARKWMPLPTDEPEQRKSTVKLEPITGSPLTPKTALQVSEFYADPPLIDLIEGGYL